MHQYRMEIGVSPDQSLKIDWSHCGRTHHFTVADMEIFNWDHEKNEMLKQERGISFEEIVFCIENGFLLDIIEHLNQEKYSGQKIYAVNLNEYVYLVPYVESEDKIFLKTAYPSRKYTKNYLRR